MKEVHIKGRFVLPDVVVHETDRFPLPGDEFIAVVPHIAWEWITHNEYQTMVEQESVGRPFPAGAHHLVDYRATQERQFAESGGLQRLLRTLEDLDARISVLISGRTVAEFPDLAREVRDRGHDVGSQNWEHVSPIMYDEPTERADLQRTVDTFQEVLRLRPSGYVSPGGRSTPQTAKLLMEHGYVWQGDYYQAEIPFVIEWQSRRLACFGYGQTDYRMRGSGALSPRAYYEMLRDNFECLYAEGRKGYPKVMGFAVHPWFALGFRTRPWAEFLDDVRSRPRVWFTTRTEVGRWALETIK